jgi:hypothetical protein
MSDPLKPAIDASLKALGQDMTAELDRKLRALATVPKVTHPELSDFPITIRVENTDKQITLSRAQALDVYRVLDALFGEPETRSENELLEDSIEVLRDALFCALNIEGPALRGGELPVYQGLDVPYHFEQIRSALKLTATED